MSKALAAGTRLRFAEEKLAYMVRVSDWRYAICTKPFNPRKTVLYCIVDFVAQIRAPEDLVFGFGAETQKQCEAMLKRLQDGESGLSHRHQADLKILEFAEPNSRIFKDWRERG